MQKRSELTTSQHREMRFSMLTVVDAQIGRFAHSRRLTDRFPLQTAARRTCCQVHQPPEHIPHRQTGQAPASFVAARGLSPLTLTPPALGD